MPSEPKYTGPYANVETYELPEQLSTEPLQKPWYPPPAVTSQEVESSKRYFPYSSPGQRYKRRWLETVASRQAKEAVLAAHEFALQSGALVPWLRSDGDYLGNRHQNPDTLAYRSWVRSTLRTSGLAERLPSGLSEFPDIYAEMPSTWATIERLRKPRTFPQLVRHLARHLEWYLDPTQPVRVPLWPWQLLLSLAFSALFSGFTFLVGPMDNAAIRALEFLAVPSGIALGCVLPYAYNSQKVNGQTLYRHQSWRLPINAAELFYYLEESYSELEKPREQTSEESASPS